jgi:hypothetical protein
VQCSKWEGREKQGLLKMGQDNDEPPIRLFLAALFIGARIVRGNTAGVDVPGLVAENLELADELIRQGGPPA